MNCSHLNGKVRSLFLTDWSRRMKNIVSLLAVGIGIGLCPFATEYGFSQTAPTNTGRTCPNVPPGDYETYGLPPITSQPAGIDGMIDWSLNPANGGWNGRQVMDACRYQADPLGFTTWHGKAAARIEVNPGDDPLNLGSGSERAEMLILQDVTGTAVKEGVGTVYYATSYYFPTTWDGTFIHGDPNSWSFVLQTYPNGGLTAARHDVGAPQIYTFSGTGSSTTLFTFSDGGAISLGKWTDFVFMINYSTGHLIWWRRDEGQTAFTKVIDGTDRDLRHPKSGMYIKQGLYRGGDVNGRTDVLWVGPFARGSSFLAVEGAAFGTSVGQP